MSLRDVILEYLDYLNALGRSPLTIKGARCDLCRFAKYLEGEAIHQITDISKEVLADYQQELVFYLTASGKPLSARTRAQRLGVIKGFTRFLQKFDYLVHDPGQDVDLPKKPRRLPRVILSEQEIQKLFNAPDMQTRTGYRNRIILEVLYDTAVRRAEMAAIKLVDIDPAGYIQIRGKGDKDRVVPVSERVCGLIRNYVLMVRPGFVRGDDPGYLILNRWGQKMDPNSVWAVVKRCARQAGLQKRVATHTFRHTCATHMLKNGAPVRHLQEMLGHESLESTQIYTRVTINDLKQIHSQCHPSESLSDTKK